MKHFSLFFCLLFLYNALLSQNVYTIKADSVKISSADSAELLIENHTQGVPGFLFNKGNGRTEFRRGLVKISDTLYLVGADTLHLNNSGGMVTGSNVFYVSKQYTGIAGAKLTGNTLASISSANPSYNSQLMKAIPGSMALSYPDPFSARNAALDAIATGKIAAAQIVILQGNKYTIGSNDSTKNGSVDGQNPNNGTVADIQIANSAIAADTSISSIMKNKVDMYFFEGTSLTYINSFYAIYCYFNNDTTVFKSAIYGRGSFYQVYGGVNNFIAMFAGINNPHSSTDFHAHELILQQWQGFYLYDFAVSNIDVDNLITADANTFSIGKTRNTGPPPTGIATNSPRMLNINVKNCRYGKGQTPYPDNNSWWHFFNLMDNNSIEGTCITMNIGNFDMKSTAEGPIFHGGMGISQSNVRLTVNIDNLVQRDAHINHNIDSSFGLIYFSGSDYAVNTTITYNIKAATIEAPLLGKISANNEPVNKNNHLYINVGTLQKNLSAFQGGIFYTTNVTSGNGGEPYIIKITGNYKSYDSSAIVIALNHWYSFPFSNRYEFSGKYETAVNGLPIAHFYTNTGKLIAFTDALLINDGTTPSIMADSLCVNFACNCCQNPATPINIPVYIKNVQANSAPGTNIQQIGDTIKVYSDIYSFFN